MAVRRYVVLEETKKSYQRFPWYCLGQLRWPERPDATEPGACRAWRVMRGRWWWDGRVGRKNGQRESSNARGSLEVGGETRENFFLSSKLVEQRCLVKGLKALDQTTRRRVG